MARPDQCPPSEAWHIWLLLGGRGSGKTRSGAEWIREQVWQRGRRHIALIAPSLSEAREVLIEGESGLANIGYVAERPTFTASRRLLKWANGAVGHVFSAADPNSLRGPQFDCAWADEFCSWDYPEDTLSNLRLALRLGERPQLVVTTTPKPSRSLAALMDAPGLITTRSTTQQNTAHLAPGFLAMMEEAYGGTTLGRQELGGEIIDSPEGGLWSRALLAQCRADKTPEFDKVILAVDPPGSRDARGDACGIIVAGYVSETSKLPARGYVLFDGTVQGLSTGTWAERVIGLWRSWDADYIVAEANMGGDMVTDILRARAPDAVIRKVFATRGKRSRAEPVAALYEQGRIFHTGRLDKLEDELVHMGSAAGHKNSPDRADALVWAMTDLLVKGRSVPRVRWG